MKTSVFELVSAKGFSSSYVCMCVENLRLCQPIPQVPSQDVTNNLSFIYHISLYILCSYSILLLFRYFILFFQNILYFKFQGFNRLFSEPQQGVHPPRASWPSPPAGRRGSKPPGRSNYLQRNRGSPRYSTAL